MKFKDYISYMNVQHDEDPLYIFEEKFGETAPDLLKDYKVPHLFQEEYFDVLDGERRPPFRWLIIGPERSGASWHVDPSLTSAWNTLLCGRKRWALYPPGRVPLGVTVHVNDEDDDVNIETPTPTSLQWWLEYYPLLSEHDKPIECTQLPGELIYVPTGVCRAGLLALDEGGFEDVEKNTVGMVNDDITRKRKGRECVNPVRMHAMGMIPSDCQRVAVWFFMELRQQHRTTRNEKLVVQTLGRSAKT